MVGDLLHSVSLPIVVDVHVEVIGVTVLRSSAEAVEILPGADHYNPLVIFMLCWGRAPDTVLVLLDVSWSIHLREDLVLFKMLRLAFRR
jgi:hypothetical protein